MLWCSRYAIRKHTSRRCGIVPSGNCSDNRVGGMMNRELSRGKTRLGSSVAN
jgi:hypothetical protein